MSTIEKFSSGLVTFIYFIFSEPKRVVWVVVILAAIIFASVIPVVIYIYPLGQKEPEHRIHHLKDINDVKVKFIVPEKLIPNQKYDLRLELKYEKKKKSKPHPVFIKIDRDKSYVIFANQSSLPIVIREVISPGRTLMKNLSFDVLKLKQPHEPVTFNIDIKIGRKTRSGSFIIPVDYFSIPVISILVILLPLLANAIIFLFKKFSKS